MVCKHGLKLKIDCHICGLEKENELLKSGVSKLREKIRAWGEGEWAEEAISFADKVLDQVSE